jgi:hypothetical protein
MGRPGCGITDSAVEAQAQALIGIHISRAIYRR